MKGRTIETKPLGRKVMVHGSMLYKCERCGNIFKMYLERGLEDRVYEAVHPGTHKPVPFAINCTCERGAIATHQFWYADEEFDHRELLEEECYFENAEGCDCGKPHIRNNGMLQQIEEMTRVAETTVKVIKENKEDILQAAENLILKGDNSEEIPAGIAPQEQEQSEEKNDDPYGLAHISTTTLKRELRRRKEEFGWNKQDFFSQSQGNRRKRK